MEKDSELGKGPDVNTLFPLFSSENHKRGFLKRRYIA